MQTRFVSVTLDAETQGLGIPPPSYDVSGPLSPVVVNKLRKALRLRGFDDEAVRRAEVSVAEAPFS